MSKHSQMLLKDVNSLPLRVKSGYPHKVGHAYIQYISHSSDACHFERSEKTLESVVCGFKGFLATLEMTTYGFLLFVQLHVGCPKFHIVAQRRTIFINF